jgi:hypothetical protein
MAITVTGPLTELRELFAVSDPAMLNRLNDMLLTLSAIGTNQGEIMATLQDVKDTIAQERQQVSDGIAALTAQIAALQAQLANGTVVTQADLDALNALIQDIFTPVP